MTDSDDLHERERAIDRLISLACEFDTQLENAEERLARLQQKTLTLLSTAEDARSALAQCSERLDPLQDRVETLLSTAEEAQSAID